MTFDNLPKLAQAPADVLATFRRHGFIPTTDEQRAEMQRRNQHVEQCLCRFCQAAKRGVAT